MSDGYQSAQKSAALAASTLGYEVSPDLYVRLHRFLALSRKVSALDVLARDGTLTNELRLLLAIEMTAASRELIEASEAHGEDMRQVEEKGEARDLALQAKAAGNGNV